MSENVILSLKCRYCHKDIDYLDVKSLVGCYTKFLEIISDHLKICGYRKRQVTLDYYKKGGIKLWKMK